jgi:hypothetical protein
MIILESDRSPIVFPGSQEPPVLTAVLDVTFDWGVNFRFEKCSVVHKSYLKIPAAPTPCTEYAAAPSPETPDA